MNSDKQPQPLIITGASGRKANRRGRIAENIIADMLKERGYTIERQKVICKSIYCQKIRTDIFISNTPDFPNNLAVESKWQGSRGSADEKYPYLVSNIKERYPCPAIVVIGGGGMRESAEQWLRNQVDGEQLLAVYSFEEFIAWLMDN